MDLDRCNIVAAELEQISHVGSFQTGVIIINNDFKDISQSLTPTKFHKPLVKECRSECF